MKSKTDSTDPKNDPNPECLYEIPISTIYNPSTNQTSVPVVSIYNPNLNQNSRPPEKEKSKLFSKICIENLKAQFHKDQRKKVEFYLAVCFIITLVATGAIIVIMHKRTTNSNLLVHGEFTILNEPYSESLSERNSLRFREFEEEICQTVGSTFLTPSFRQDLSDFYRSCRVTHISPEMKVHMLLTFANDPSVKIGDIGYKFLKGLRILHGKTWLTEFSINVQSIGFSIVGDEGKWTDWSEWGDCNGGVQIRTRQCLSKAGESLTSVEKCLLIPGNKSDLDIRRCIEDNSTIQSLVVAKIEEVGETILGQVEERPQNGTEHVILEHKVRKERTN